ncbi:hypothetical protein [Methylobacterium persicinum]|uniref:Secreted protein n=1 Tax=Methylobacterium persicinum TaxID=374426 RepID=A0ABU0HPC4_9HYPH|nr:hypothetical protein [Methylobacterium persicinum]MDQ0444170.1 hypothetical protein [Methylobacterium persicinum]GJE36130.1 hypothetical protein KHHGKMAE_0177 [Methylobacterium persicinum]
MRLTTLTGLILLAAAPAAAQGTGDQGSRGKVPVCDSLLALRQLSAAAGEDRDRAAAQVGGQPGCRLVAQDQIGDVQRRAMFGGGAYECAAIAGGPCAWVMP